MELERRARAQAEKKRAKETFLVLYRTMGENLLHRLRYDRSEQVPQVGQSRHGATGNAFCFSYTGIGGVHGVSDCPRFFIPHPRRGRPARRACTLLHNHLS